LKGLHKKLDTASLGLEMGGAVALGYFVGTWVDEAYGLAPYGSAFFMLVGFGAAAKALIRVAKSYKKEIAQQGGEA
jgi:F0F1-type ATP synthase assembly protein I